ncbi:Serine/threonine-protein kinase 19 [Coccomyxa sp. Obi]|nr:Serine/threonine-protein kinase 19 [Coccomyxa sp. Obi]
MARVPKRRRLARIYDDDIQAASKVAEESSVPEGAFVDAPAGMPAAEMPQNAEEVDDDDFGELPNDTLAAVLALRAQFPSGWSRDVPPLVLKSQIYSIVKDRTIVDRQLDELRLQNKLRLFKLLTLHDGYAYLPTDDYQGIIARITQLQQEKGTAENVLAALQWYQQRVLPSCTGIDISHADLIWHLSRDDRGSEAHERVTEAHISLLLHVGLLTRHSVPDRFLFAVPNAGPIVKGIIAGRKELLGMLTRRRHPEMFVKELEKKKLNSSPLGMRWHIRDLVGSGALMQTQTTEVSQH